MGDNTQVFIPEHLADVVEPVTQLIHQLRELTITCLDANVEFELEARMGTFDTARGCWINGVSKTFWEQVLQMFVECDHWTEVADTEWKHNHDYFYTLPDGRAVRSSTTLESGPIFDIQHLIKRRHGLVDLHVPGSDTYDIRIALSSETTLSSHELPETVMPTRVRIKQRMSFVFRCWKFDLTKVWSGDSRLSAETAQRSGTPDYEIELECSSPMEYLQARPDEYVATSLLLKMCDLLPKPLGKLDLFVHPSVQGHHK